jgi:hypothetical protein
MAAAVYFIDWWRNILPQGGETPLLYRHVYAGAEKAGREVFYFVLGEINVSGPKNRGLAGG